MVEVGHFDPFVDFGPERMRGRVAMHLVTDADFIVEPADEAIRHLDGLKAFFVIGEEAAEELEGGGDSFGLSLEIALSFLLLANVSADPT